MKFRAMAVALFWAASAAAQGPTEGVIEGMVADATGAVVSGAVIRASSVHTSRALETSSDSEGIFRFLAVPAGTYDVVVRHAGFAPMAYRQVNVAVGERVNLSAVLQVGTREEEVVVHGEAAALEITRTAVSGTVDQRAIATLPLNGRNFLNYVLLTPGIVNQGPFFSVGGQLSMNSLLIDGADHNGFVPQPIGTAAPNRYLFSQESIQEFQVNLNAYSAEFGRAGTAVINVITKSGTNQFHGSAFWYYRDRGLNATGAMEKLNGEPKQPFHGHQFGGTVGGPLARDRLFFYASYDGQRRSEQNLTALNVPSGFRFSTDPTVASFQRQALEYLEARAAPYLRTFNQQVTLGKVEGQISEKHVLRGGWNRHRLEAPNFANVGPQQSLEHTGSVTQIADTVTLSMTSQVSARSVNVFRFSYVDNSNPLAPNSHLPEAIVSEGQQILQVGRSPRLPVNNAIRRAEWADTSSLSRGRHSLKLGGTVLLERGQFFSAVNFFGSYRFNSLESFGRSLAELPVCPAVPQCRPPQAGERYIQAFSGAGEAPIDVHPNAAVLGGFVQDTWRLRPDFTLDLGLRYEVQIMNQARVRNPAPELAAAGVDTSYIPSGGNTFAPRLGFAWSLLRSERLVVRGGYGLHYPRLIPATAARAFFQNGITVQTRTFTGAAIPAYPNTACGAPTVEPPACGPPMGGADIIMAIPRSYRPAVVQQGSLGAEYVVGKSLEVGATYLRIRSDHLTHWQDINLPPAQTATIGIANTGTVLEYQRYSGPRPITGFDRVLMLNANAASNYHGLALHTRKRWSRGFQFMGSYTLGKALDDNPTLGVLNPGAGDGELLSDSGDAALDRGPSNTDQRHRFVLSGTWELKQGKNLPQPARALLTGWELSGILAVDAGLPYSGWVNFDLNNDGNASTDRVPRLPRNTFRLPTTVVFDARLARRVRLSERVNLQLRLDGFNVFNRANYNGVRTTMFARSTPPHAGCPSAGVACLVPQNDGETAFGTPNSALDPRILQLSAKLEF